MRYLLHHSDATYNSTSKKWFFTLDRRISNPRSVTLKKCVFTASTADSYPSIVYMRSDALHGLSKTKHTVELKNSDHENSSDVIAILEETHTHGRYAMKDQGVTFPVHGHTHLRSIDIYFTDGTTKLAGTVSEGAVAADDSTISSMSASVLLVWWDMDTLSTLLDSSGNAISGTVGDGIRTLQSRSPGATSVQLTAADEQMQYVVVGESHGITSLASNAVLEDLSFPNITSSNDETYMFVFRVPTVTTADVILFGNYHIFLYFDLSDSSVARLQYWHSGNQAFTDYSHDFVHGDYYLFHATVTAPGGVHTMEARFRNLAGSTVVTQTITPGENANMPSSGEWNLGINPRPSWWPGSDPRPMNYSATMSNLIIMDGASTAQIEAAETWLLAKYGVATASEGDKDATFFTELEVKASNR